MPQFEIQYSLDGSAVQLTVINAKTKEEAKQMLMQEAKSADFKCKIISTREI